MSRCPFQNHSYERLVTVEGEGYFVCGVCDHVAPKPLTARLESDHQRRKSVLRYNAIEQKRK